MGSLPRAYYKVDDEVDVLSPAIKPESAIIKTQYSLIWYLSISVIASFSFYTMLV
jgi:hypothetical protein